MEAPPVLRRIKAALDAVTGRPFNSVLVNRYRTGEDAMGWHSDDEKVMHPSGTAALNSPGQGAQISGLSDTGLSKFFRIPHNHI